jgi:hypothetical protein
MVAVPDGQVRQGTQLREVLVVEKHKALKNVALDPKVGVDVERLDDTLATAGHRHGQVKNKIN